MVFKRKNSSSYYFKFAYNGALIYESAKTPIKRIAEEAERKRRRDLERGLHRLTRPKSTPLFRAAAKRWLEERVSISPLTKVAYRYYVGTLTKEFGPRLVCDISAEDITDLQRRRQAAGFGGRRINAEIAVLQQILRKHGAWAVVADDVERLPERNDVGRAISADDERALLDAVKASGSPSLLPLVVVSLDTGLRASEIRSLRRQDLHLEWEDGRIVRGGLTPPKSKTAAGTGRYVPLTQRSCAVLTLWLDRFPDAKIDSYVFPQHSVTLAGGKVARLYSICLDKPMGTWKTAWYRALTRAHLTYRWHDLRHTFVTRLCENPRASEQTIKSLAGHVSKRMLDRYSHIRTEAKRQVIEDLSETVGGEEVLQNWLHSRDERAPLAS